MPTLDAIKETLQATHQVIVSVIQFIESVENIIKRENGEGKEDGQEWRNE